MIFIRFIENHQYDKINSDKIETLLILTLKVRNKKPTIK